MKINTTKKTIQEQNAFLSSMPRIPCFKDKDTILQCGYAFFYKLEMLRCSTSVMMTDEFLPFLVSLLVNYVAINKEDAGLFDFVIDTFNLQNR